MSYVRLLFHWIVLAVLVAVVALVTLLLVFGVGWGTSGASVS